MVGSLYVFFILSNEKGLALSFHQTVYHLKKTWCYQGSTLDGTVMIYSLEYLGNLSMKYEEARQVGQAQKFLLR
jgi:hypothetical protein